MKFTLKPLTSQILDKLKVKPSIFEKERDWIYSTVSGVQYMVKSASIEN